MKKALCSVVVALLTTAAPAVSQTIWTPIDRRPFLKLEMLHPSLKAGSDVDISALSGAVFMTGGFRLGQRAMFIAELPFARSSVSFAGTSSSNTAFGNPYIGLQLGSASKSRGFVGELGVRPPFIGDDDFDAALLGISSDLDRLEAFVNDVTSISAAGNFYSRMSAAATRLRLGVTHQLHGSSSGEDETFLDYGAHASYDADRLRFGGAVTGRYILTESGAFGERSVHHIAGSASMAFDQLRPGIFVRVPIDKDVRESVSAIYGLTLEYTFP